MKMNSKIATDRNFTVHLQSGKMSHAASVQLSDQAKISPTKEKAMTIDPTWGANSSRENAKDQPKTRVLAIQYGPRHPRMDFYARAPEGRVFGDYYYLLGVDPATNQPRSRDSVTRAQLMIDASIAPEWVRELAGEVLHHKPIEFRVRGENGVVRVEVELYQETRGWGPALQQGIVMEIGGWLGWDVVSYDRIALIARDCFSDESVQWLLVRDGDEMPIGFGSDKMGGGRDWSFLTFRPTISFGELRRLEAVLNDVPREVRLHGSFSVYGDELRYVSGAQHADREARLLDVVPRLTSVIPGLPDRRGDNPKCICLDRFMAGGPLHPERATCLLPVEPSSVRSPGLLFADDGGLRPGD